MSRKSLILLVTLVVVGAAVPTQAALVSYWPFDGGSGGTAVNSVNTAYNGTLSSFYMGSTSSWNVPSWTADSMFGGHALQFTSSASVSSHGTAPVSYAENFVTAPSGGGAAGLTAATVSLWVKWNDVQNVYTVADSNTNGLYGTMIGSDQGGSGTWAIGVNATNSSTPGTQTSNPASMKGLRLAAGGMLNWNGGYVNNTSADGVGTYGEPQSGTAFTAPGTGNWNNIVLTVSSSSWSVYMNGALLRTLSGGNGIPNTAAPLTIGAGLQNGSGTYCGSNTMIDDTGIFSSVLSAGQLRGIYTAPTFFTAAAGANLYSLGEMNTLYTTTYATKDAVTGTSIGTLTWKYDGSLNVTGHSVGDTWSDGSGDHIYLSATGGAGSVPDGLTAAIPEPGTLALLAAGLIGLLCYAWRKRR